MNKRYLGVSSDQRTNRWEISCNCGYKMRPETTMSRYQVVRCPKCGKVEKMDYNKE